MRGRGTCTAEGGGGACMAGEMATAADGMHFCCDLVSQRIRCMHNTKN